MNLKQLKLAGFKSFVDPTVVPFPSQLVAVVGPNGCGKSNIIDAVRWVMGESSAKTLRGDSMTDVIFNGSSSRKAVGQASVELIFDNSFGRLTGQYASYQEIAVKRVVDREGSSTYFLNGTRCRRSDITDIFLGTGAGSKGYSIIGQGTISKLIEARPEELRAYLEEAAGISKYKDRRKETLTRISHTRENLTRVADVREELDRQLQRLERQAKTAERYQILKEEESLIKAEILALKWQQLHEEQEGVGQVIREQQLTFEKHQAAIALVYQQNTQLREQIHSVNEHVNAQQTSYYHLTTEIARLEENVQQQQREKQRLQQEQQQLQQQWQTLSAQQQQDEEKSKQSSTVLSQLQSQLQTLTVQLQTKEQQWQQSQQQYDQWQVDYNAAQTARQQAVSDHKIQHMTLQHLSQRRQEIQARMESIQRDEQQLEIDVLHNKRQQLHQQTQAAATQLAEDEEAYQQHSTHSKVLTQQLQDIEKELRQQQDKGYQLNTQHAALTAMMQAALGRQEAGGDWQDNKRLVESIQVEEQWQVACEMVLQEGLHAVVVDSLSTLYQELSTITQDVLIVSTPTIATNSKKSLPTLADKITGLTPQWPVAVESIFAAATLAQALEWLPHIQAGESIVTPDGYWLGQHFVKIKRPDNSDKPSLLARQQELAQLQSQAQQAEEQLSALKQQRDTHYQLSLQQEERHRALQEQLNASREAARVCRAESEACERLLQQTISKQEQLTREQQELMTTLEENASNYDTAAQAVEKLQQATAHYEQLYQTLSEQKTQHYAKLMQEKQAVDALRSSLHQYELQTTREQLSAKQILERMQLAVEELQRSEDQLQHLASQLIEMENPATPIKTILQEKITQQQQAETSLTALREQVATLNQQMDNGANVLKAEEKQAGDVQQQMQHKQMEEQALKVRASTIAESLKEIGMQPQEMLRLMPQDVTVSAREQVLLETVAKINRLGAINLAAIEEYQQQAERKNYLDKQYHDLQEAIQVLENAIEKMDKETRQRFQETFDAVNLAFQNLFPRLFGGGHAMLTLNCDNLLEAGVLVMAQPPGKRNSTIHLLSGGEKAMTAVALIFAIFQLNPSPFCMLDEVDAPLDDVNVGRFCALVKEMSQVVQFLFITHNKLTMELADHLIGVTMREPGVSRMVAVDVEQALSMSES